jgi:hypothetical protein
VKGNRGWAQNYSHREVEPVTVPRNCRAHGVRIFHPGVGEADTLLNGAPNRFLFDPAGVPEYPLHLKHDHLFHDFCVDTVSAKIVDNKQKTARNDRHRRSPARFIRERA